MHKERIDKLAIVTLINHFYNCVLRSPPPRQWCVLDCHAIKREEFIILTKSFKICFILGNGFQLNIYLNIFLTKANVILGTEIPTINLVINLELSELKMLKILISGAFWGIIREA